MCMRRDLPAPTRLAVKCAGCVLISGLAKDLQRGPVPNGRKRRSEDEIQGA